MELFEHSDLDDPDRIGDLTKDEISFHQAVRVPSSHGLAWILYLRLLTKSALLCDKLHLIDVIARATLHEAFFPSRSILTLIP